MPSPQKDPRFGIITGGSSVSYHLNALNIDWYIDYNADPRTAPPGKTKVPFIQANPGDPRISETTLASYAQARPGSYWYIGGEPNRYGAAFTPEAFVGEFDYYVSTIKAADPNAKIIGPSILNWDFTCIGCGGFTSGSAWMKGFFEEYEAAHGLGVLPPIDVYATDVYPLTWNSVPMTHWEILAQDLTAYRTWLDSKGLSAKPIWITEIASHWAYDSWQIVDNKLTIGPGLDWDADYRWDAMSSYLINLFGWLRDNSQSKKIEKWFLFRAYSPIRQVASTEGYAGIYLFETDDAGAPLNQLGQLYKDMASGVE